jgi:hypothetical protein
MKSHRGPHASEESKKIPCSKGVIGGLTLKWGHRRPYIGRDNRRLLIGKGGG